jgi:hypothetical protein
MALLSNRDAAMRVSVSRIGLRLAFILAMAAAVGLASDRPLLGFAHALELCGYFMSLGAMVRAVLNREQPQGDSISGWDEAVGFGFVALAAHVAIGVLR